MESLTSWGYISPTTPEKLHRLREYYDSQVKPKGEKLSLKISEKLLSLLLSITNDVEQSLSVNQKLTPNAKVGLELFYYFLQADDEFQDSVERKETYLLAKQLDLGKHLKDEDSKHADTTKDLIAFMIKNFPKFVDWLHEFTSSEEKPRESMEISRFSQEGRLPPEGLYYDTDFKSVMKLFKTDPTTGLVANEVKDRLERYGKNKLPEPPPVSPLKLMWHQISEFMVLILLIVAIISFPLEDYVEGAVLLLVVITNCTIGFVQEWKAEKTLQSLKLLTVQTAKVQRNSNQEVVESTELVPGDIVILDEGDSIPADLRIFDSQSLQIIESVLTGEANPISKTTDAIKKPGLSVGDRTNMAFMSTVVSKGRGRGVVVATGHSTEVGKISKALTKPKTKKTILQQRLDKLGKILVVLSVVLCALVVAIGFLTTWIKTKEITKDDVIEWIKVGISLAVSVIPEGLVAVTTITYAIGIGRMAQRHAVCRKLPAVETVGSVTTICSDKTGTLTEGKMTATILWVSGKKYEISGTGLSPEGGLERNGDKVTKLTAGIEKAMMIASLCNNATLEKDKERPTLWKSSGDPTEVAIVVASRKVNLGKEEWLSKGYKFVAEAPFDSDRKRMSVVYTTPDGKRVLLAKGAPESIVPICSTYWRKKKVIDISKDHIHGIEKANMAMGSEGLRVLALSFRELTESEGSTDKIEALELKGGMTFVSLVGMIDPPRKEVKPTIVAARSAGIRVCMITGDHPRTAFAIGTKLGIIESNEEHLVVNGVQLDAMAKGDLAALPKFPTVFARVSPANKLKIVNALQLKGEICAMTGDGTNDAPAIKNADVGIAMGTQSTDMAKNSADIILTDDNFITIVEAIKEGRRTYDNIKKFVSYLLSCNSAEIWVMLFAVVGTLPPPFTPIMILWANLIADIPPALALGVDPAVSNIMKRLPRDPKKGIFTVKTILQLLFYGVSMASLAFSVYILALFSWYKEDRDEMENSKDVHELPTRSRELAFVALTCMQLSHSFLVKSSGFSYTKDLFNNKWLIGGVLLSLVLLVAGIYIPGLNGVLNQTPLEGKDWAAVIVCVIIHAIFVEVFKHLYRYLAKRQLKKKPDLLFYNDG